MKILVIAGSLRKGSLNRQLAEAASTYLESKAFGNVPKGSVSAEILDYSEVPLFNEDIEFPLPASVAEVRRKVKNADAIWFFTPEYNHYFSGVLKNLIDWLSRPVSDEEGQLLSGKPAAFSGISMGGGGTTSAQDHLVALLSFLNMKLMNAPRLAIANGLEQVENGKLILTASRPYLERQADAFVEFVKQ